MQVCQATLQLFDVLVQCPLPAVLQELVFGQQQHAVSSTSPGTPASQVEDSGNVAGMAGERKKLQDSVSRFVKESLFF